MLGLRAPIHLPSSEKERGCLRRAFERFAARVTPLCALLGQMIGPIKPSVGECWSGLRQLDNLEGILLLLGHKVQHFTSGRLPLPAARILSGNAPSDDWTSERSRSIPHNAVVLLRWEPAAGSPAHE